MHFYPIDGSTYSQDDVNILLVDSPTSCCVTTTTAARISSLRIRIAAHRIRSFFVMSPMRRYLCKSGDLVDCRHCPETYGGRLL